MALHSQSPNVFLRAGRDKATDAFSKPVVEFEPISGRVLLASGDEFSCTATLLLPPIGIVFVRAKRSLSEVVVCALDNVGILVGQVTEVQSTGFRVAFRIKDHRREKIAARLEWHSAQAHRSSQLRRAPRLVPVHRSVEVRFAEAVAISGTILDISMSGAAIALRRNPGAFVGGLVRIGSRFATVVRAMEGGIAVQFVEPFTAENFDERVRL